jgi:hypothetical protein
LRTKLEQGKQTIQIGRSHDARKEHLFYPWSLIYDIPMDDTDPSFVPCKLLDNWTPGTALPETEKHDCPFKATHKTNTICPFGFWGFKHIIEQPPFITKSHSLETEISVSPGGKMEMVMGYHNGLPALQGHLGNLNKILTNTKIIPESSRDDFFNALEQSDLELIYFFCHGKRLQDPGAKTFTPYLEIGDNEKITIKTLGNWQDALPDIHHWKNTKPLVFINGCHTAELTPDALANFVDRFIDLDASGVIGTEVTIEERLASEIAELFFLHLVNKNNTVGEAIRAVRFGFLTKGNVMGLAYTPYCSADLHLKLA